MTWIMSRTGVISNSGNGNYRRTPFFIVFIRDGIIGAFLQAHIIIPA